MTRPIDKYLSDDPELRQRQLDWVDGLEADVLVCRASRRHDFPELDPFSEKIPKGMRTVLQSDGCYQIISRCRRCGRQRTETTLPGGYYDSSVILTYKDPEGYSAPRGLGLPGNAVYKARVGEVRAETFRAAHARRAKAEAASRAAV